MGEWADYHSEEVEAMYDWIEEHHGLSPEEDEGSEEWDEAIQEFEAVCDEQDRLEEEYYQNELEWYLYSKSPVGIFNSQMHNIQLLLSTKVHDQAQFSLLVMLHGHAVATLEAYLASTFLQHVINSDDLIKKLVESDPKFSKMKFTLNNIFVKKDNLRLIVANHLKELIFHKLEKVKPMFKAVLDCDLGDIGWLFKAIKTRHHCVHRAGLDKDGNQIDISIDSINQLITNLSNLVDHIEQTPILLEKSNEPISFSIVRD